MKVDIYNITEDEAAQVRKTLDGMFGKLIKQVEVRTAKAKDNPDTPRPNLVGVHYRHGVFVSLTKNEVWRQGKGKRNGKGKKK